MRGGAAARGGVLQGARRDHFRAVCRRNDLRGVRRWGCVYFIGSIPRCLEVAVWVRRCERPALLANVANRADECEATVTRGVHRLLFPSKGYPWLVPNVPSVPDRPILLYEHVARGCRGNWVEQCGEWIHTL